MKHIIVGGVAGGATAAARIRRIDESAEIILIERGKHISYANCGLPYYIGGEIADRESLFVQTPQSFGIRFNVDVRVENEAIEIDTKKKELIIRRADSSTYRESYDKLLLSPGASPIRPRIKGIDLEGIFTLRNVSDTDRIKNYITSNKIERAVVVGAGFIGLEMAENLHTAGAEVSIVEMNNQVMAPVDFSMAAQVHQHLLQKGVKLYLEIGAERFERIGNEIKVFLSNGESITTDIVILSIGVRPDVELANTSGIKLGDTGGIWVDKYLETSEKDIYAVGDAIEYPHPITGIPWLNYLANPANRQGRIVADNMVLGNKIEYEGAIGTSIAKVFDYTVASTGLAAKRLKQLNIPYISSVTHSNSHAEYYPNAMPLTVKLMFSPDNGRILGASIVGYDGVDKRIDQIALLIKKEGTIQDLIELEHAYAPPYSSAKDPIAIAGYVANNILTAEMPVVTWRDMAHITRDSTSIIDVRINEEFEIDALPGARNIPLDELRDRLDEIPRNKAIIVYCQIGLRGYLATQILRKNGFENVRNLAGGFKTYHISTAPVSYVEPLIVSEESVSFNEANLRADIKVHKINAAGLQCPGPILKLKNAIDEISNGERIEITSSDPGFPRDAQAWCNSTGNELISSSADKGLFTVVIEKGSKTCSTTKTSCDDRGKSMIMFSDDLDKALATMVLANGAAATGEKVTIFFTFWGLNVIKKVDKPKVKKDFVSRMFSAMLPSSSKKLKLSKMSMMGMGGKMMRNIMKNKNIASLETLMDQAIENGVEFIACQMSMDVMGVTKEELMDNVTIGGVATYIEKADASNINLFI